jgi:hypothetical protein
MTTMASQPGEQSRDSGATATLMAAPNPAEGPARRSHSPLALAVSEPAGPQSKLTTYNYPELGWAWGSRGVCC